MTPRLCRAESSEPVLPSSHAHDHRTRERPICRGITRTPRVDCRYVSVGEPRSRECAAETVKTPTGVVLTVTPTTGLAPAGATVTVTGRGYDRTVGIYLTLCVTPQAVKPPSPCGGGVHMTGANPASAWISSNPPPYGQKLATPFAEGGRFKARMTVSSTIGTVDCRTVSCLIVTRADHLHSGDRRFGVVVPVTFRQ